MASAGTRKLDALTSLRFFAAVFIVLAHIRGNFGISPTLGLENFQFAQGVSFFFVLSGFILTYVYQHLEGREAVRRFLVARIARLWPAHALALGISAAFLVNPGLGWNTRTLLQTLASVLMVHAWIPSDSYYHFLNSVAWSISTEFFFYLAFVLLIGTLRQTWVWKTLVCLSAAIILCLAGEAGLIKLSIGSLTYVGPLGRVFEFVLGMGFALVFRRLQEFKCSTAFGTAIELAALSVMVVTAHCAHRFCHGDGWIADHLGRNIASWLSWGPGAAPAFGLLILVMALERGWLSRILSAPLLVLLGELSYSVYLLHILLLRAYKQHETAFAETPNWLLLAGFWTILLLVSHIVWGLWERPMRTFILARWAKRPTSAAARPAASPAPDTTLWARLLAPGSRLIGFELLLLFGLSIPIYSMATKPPYSMLTAAEALKQSDANVLGNAPFDFDSRFTLRSVTYRRVDNGFKVNLVWESCLDQNLDNWVCLHLLDSDQKRCTEIGRQQDPRGRRIAKGAFWTEEIFVPNKNIGGDIEKLAIGLWHPKNGTLPSKQAIDDHEHWRVLLPIPNEQIALQTSQDLPLRR